MAMNMTKTIKVPFIKGLESVKSLEELDLIMEEKASKFAVCERNWPADAPYSPDCNGAVAYSDGHLAVMYHVRGLDLRATAMEDNGRSWEDSCCEFFISDPLDGTYYNFELTCIGSLLASRRKSREESTPLSLDDLGKVTRFSSLEHRAWDESGTIFSWTVAMIIPFDLIGIRDGEIPSSLKGNFYKCGDLTAHPHFLSWNPVGTPSPDFHRPEFFGEIVFEKR